MRTKRTKIKTALNTFATDGSIFYHLPRYGDVTAKQMGIAYVLQHSGEKLCTNLVENYLDDDNHITEEGLNIIGSILTNMYKDSWDRMWAAITAEYNPIENYDRNSEITDEKEGTDTTVDKFAEKHDSSTIGNQTNSDTIGGGTDTTENEISAFNSLSYQDSNKTTNTVASRTNSITLGGRSDSITYGSHDDEHETTYGSKVTRTEHTHGNIGVTTNQQMIESELELRKKNFYQIIFKDVDSYLALKIRPLYTDYGTLKDNRIKLQVSRKEDGVLITARDSEGTTTAEIKDGITPKFRINNDNLEVSYDAE